MHKNKHLMMKPMAWAVIAALAYLPAARAADSERQLAEVTVQGERAPSLPENLPASTAGMSAGDIAKNVNVINTEDTVKYLPSVQIRKRYIGDRNSIIATRTSGQTSSARSLLYADGLLLSNLMGNSYAYPPRWNLVSPAEISRVDMIYGPFSAEYPGNATGSVVLLSTRLPQQFEAHVKTQIFSEHFREYATDARYQGAKAEAVLGNKSGDVSWLLEAGHLDSHGHPMQFASNPKSYGGGASATVVSGTQRDSDATGQSRLLTGATSLDHTIQDNANLKLVYDISPTLRASYMLGYWQNQSDTRYDSYLRDAAGHIVDSGIVSINGQKYDLANSFQAGRREEEHLLHALSLKRNSGGSWDWEANASWYDISKDAQRTANSGSNGAGKITLQDGSGWQTVDLKGDWRPSGSRAGAHQLRVGYHYDHYVLDSRSHATSNWQNGSAGAQTDAFAGQTRTQALFVQDSWRLAPAWQLVSGARYEQWQAYGGQTMSSGKRYQHATRAQSFVSPKAALLFDLNDNWALRAAVGRAYRMPTVAELFQGSASGSNTIVNNDPNLKAEKVHSTELSAERALDAGQLRLSLFEERIGDALLSQTNTSVTPNVTNIQNIDRVKTRGVEIALENRDVLLPGLDLRGSVTYARSRIEQNAKNPASVGNPYPGIPQWRATAVVSYRQNDKLSYSLAGRYSGVQAYDVNNSVSNNEVYGANSPYLVFDARLAWQLTKQFSTAAGIDNITNNKIYAYHPMPRRTLHAELKFDY